MAQRGSKNYGAIHGTAAGTSGSIWHALRSAGRTGRRLPSGNPLHPAGRLVVSVTWPDQHCHGKPGEPRGSRKGTGRHLACGVEVTGQGAPPHLALLWRTGHRALSTGQGTFHSKLKPACCITACQKRTVHCPGGFSARHLTEADVASSGENQEIPHNGPSLHRLHTTGKSAGHSRPDRCRS